MPTLAGRTILVTRALEDAEGWAERLARLGAAPVIFPCLVSAPIDNDATATALRSALSDADWLLVSSALGVAAVAQLAGGPIPLHVRVAAVGPATARAAAERLGRVDFVPKESTSAGLGRELAAVLCGASPAPRPHSVLIAGAACGRTDAEAALDAAGIVATRIDVYCTTPAPPCAHKRDLERDGVDDVLLASPSAVTGLINNAVVPATARVITIGPTTSAAATAAGLRVAAEARRPDFNGMLEAMS